MKNEWTPSSMGKKGGANRAKVLSKERRSEIAKLANQARWEKLKTMTKIN